VNLLERNQIEFLEMKSSISQMQNQLKLTNRLDQVEKLILDDDKVDGLSHLDSSEREKKI
jgi:hypothetical protein